MTSEAKDDLIARLEPAAWMHPTQGWVHHLYDEVLPHCERDGPLPQPLYSASTIASLTEQVEGLKAKWIDADEDAKVQKEFLAAADARALAAESELSRLRAENEKMRELVQQAFRDGVIYGTNIADADPDLAWEYSRSRAVLSNTSEGGKDE